MVNDGIGNGNFTTLKPFAFWTQHVLPLVYGDEISYMETLGKMRDIMNELIKNNNNLPTYIQQMIEEYISSGAIEEVIDKILSDFILNVKYPPTGIPKSKGDGTTNDHDSIQGCIDYAAGLGGGVVYLPAGKYLTSSLVLKPGVTLLGFGRYATSLILAGGATTHLITGTVSDAGLVNLTLNAKMSSQVNRVDAVELVGNHIEIRNVVAKDCYTSINVQKNGTAINISNVLCETASDACLRVGGTDGGLLVNGLEMTGLSTNLGVAYIVTDSNGDIYRNINIHGTGALGINVAGSQNYFDGKITGVTIDYDNLGENNSFNIMGKTLDINISGKTIFKSTDFAVDSTNPISYKPPTYLNPLYDKIDFKDSSNNIYNVLVSNGSTTICNTLLDLKQLTKVVEGQYIITLGCETIGDNGGAIYYVTSLSSENKDGYSVFDVANKTVKLLFYKEIPCEVFGVIGTRDNSTNAQLLFNFLSTNNVTGIFDKEYTFSHININGEKLHLKGNGIIHPVRYNNLTYRFYNIFTASNPNFELLIENIKFIGYNGNEVQSGPTEPLTSFIIINEGKSAIFKNCQFLDGNNTWRASISPELVNRKSIIATILDTDYTEFNSCYFGNLDGEESIYVMNKHKAREKINALFDNCFYTDIGSSVLDFVGNKITMCNSVYYSTFNGSVVNCFGTYVECFNESFFGTVSNLYDNCEFNEFSGSVFTARDITHNGKSTLASFIVNAENILIDNFKGTCKYMLQIPFEFAGKTADYHPSVTTSQMSKCYTKITNCEINSDSWCLYGYNRQGSVVPVICPIFSVYFDNCSFNNLNDHPVLSANNHVKFTNCEIKNAAGPGSSSGGGLYSLPAAPFKDVSVIGCNIYNKSNEPETFFRGDAPLTFVGNIANTPDDIIGGTNTKASANINFIEPVVTV